MDANSFSNVWNQQGGAVYLRNYMLNAAQETLEEVLAQDTAACACERCKLDMTALMLNQLPAKYVVDDKGYVYSKISELVMQFKVDLTVAAVKAKDAVKKSPRH